MTDDTTTENWRTVIDEALARTSTGKRVLKQDRSRQRSAEIVAAALRVFARDGIVGARINDIAAEAGVPPASIYDYFQGKQELAYAVPIVHQTEFFAEFDEQAKRFASCRELLFHFLWLTTDYARRHPIWARVLYLEIWPSVLVKDSRVRAVLDDYSRIVVGLIVEGAERGEWPQQQNRFQTATIFIGSISQLIITWLLYRKPSDLIGAARPMIDQMMQLLDCSVSTGTGPPRRRGKRSRRASIPPRAILPSIQHNAKKRK